MSSRYHIMRAHMLLAGFILPIAMFVTGIQMARHMPGMRKPLIMAISAGLATFLCLILL